MFDLARTSAPPAGWQPQAPPDLMGERIIRLDAETNGLDWWNKARPVGWAYLLPASGRRGYLPFGHEGGGNLTEDIVKRWAQRELRGVHIDNVNTKFDGHISREWGVDLEAQGCTFGDVAHRAALLDDHRYRFNLDQLAKDFLGVDEGKYNLGLRDKGELWRLPAWEVEPYAIEDVRLVDDLVNATQPMIVAQNLEKVLALEESIIPVVMGMERNGAYLDLDTLVRWQSAATQELQQLLWDIYRASGVRMASPDSSKDLIRLFNALGLPFTAFTGSLDKNDQPKPSFTGEVLGAIDHPVIHMVLRAAQLADLKSKYLDKYLNTARSDGWIRFNLHQLRVGRTEDDKKGTVSGRFSSAGDEHGGFNVQQVVSADKQKPKPDRPKGWCPEYVIRNLFKPKNGEWGSVDADSIEYRIFCHYSNAADIIERYNALPPYETVEIEGKQAMISGPATDYHSVVQLLLMKVKPLIGRKKTKITNFAKLFGAGLIKFAFTLETITEQQAKDLWEKYADKNDKTRYVRMRAEPLLQEAVSVMDAYDEMIPSAGEMLNLASNTAKERGFVHTYLGRRARFPGGNRKHSALNRVIQGTAADINKLMLVDFHRDQKTLGVTPRFTVHDEVDFDLHDRSTVPQLEEFFRVQRVPMRVPITWGMGIGPSWGQAKGKA